LNSCKIDVIIGVAVGVVIGDIVAAKIRIIGGFSNNNIHFGMKTTIFYT
jgi:hypothetical protein